MGAQHVYRTVAELSGLSREESADLTRAVLLTLADRLSRGEIADFGSRLPDGLEESLRPSKRKPEKFGLDEFFRRISERTGLNPAETAESTAVVLTVLRDSIKDDTFDRAMSQLPGEFRQLIEPTA